MWKYIFLIALSLFFCDAYLISFMAPILKSGHHACLDLFKDESGYRRYYQVLACGDFSSAHSPAGSTLVDEDFFRNVRLFSVSGLQFLFIERILARLFGNTHRPSQLFYFFLSTVLTFLWGTNPAVFRAWIALIIRKAVSSERLNWPSALTSFVTGAVCLLLRPEWVESTPFLICWLAALLMQMRRWPFLMRVFAVTASLIPFGEAVTSSTFISGLAITLLKPLVIVVLFPLAWLVAFWPHAHTIVDYIWHGSFVLLHAIDQSAGDIDGNFNSHTTFGVFYVLAVHIALFVRDHYERKNLFWPAERFEAA